MAKQEDAYLVFVYGTLKEGQPNHYLLTEASSQGSATFVGTGETANKYPLVVGTDNNLPFLLNAEGKGENVEGEIYEVDGQKLSWLDHFESHPDFYKRDLKPIQVKDRAIDGRCQFTNADGLCQCWVYFLAKYEPEMLAQKMLKSYSSWSPHHGTYNTSEEMTSLDDS